MSTSYWSRLGEIDFSHTIKRLLEGFTGREWLFESLDNWLNQEDGEKFYLLTGEPGVGKSAIAARLTQRWTDANSEAGKLAAYHFCRAGDVETVRPGRVVRSLASQLVNTLPQYKEALKEVIDPVYLNIKSEINIGTLSNSQVTGIYIENLKNLDPREEFRLLIQKPLAALSNIYANLGETPPSVKVLLIDSLDEAATTTGQENMVTLLASLYQARETLPSWIRFLLTARPDQSVLTQFLPLQAERIEELEAKNLSDIEQYIRGRVDVQLRVVRSTPEPQINNALVSNLKPLQQRLEEANLTAEKLVSEVKDLSHGNFLYTKLLLNSIESGEQSIKNLSALPKNLNDIYHRILRYRCSFRGWLKRYQPILGVLSVAQEAITLEQLTKFIGVEPEKLKQDLEVFQQFLDQSEDEQGKPVYSIFHQSLREYLLGKQNHDFWCDAKEQHESIIEYFESKSKKWQDLEAIDLYGLRHLAQHLVKGDRVEELHRLFRLEKDGKNAWFKVKNDQGEVTSFLADVELAWSQADEVCHRDSEESIVLQCQYALIKTSIYSLSGIPKELFVTLVKPPHPYWKPEKTLAFIRQNPDMQSRFENLIALASQLTETDPLKYQVLQIALQSVQEIQNQYNRALALTILVDKLPTELLFKALEVAQSIETAAFRADALIALVDKLSEALPLALEAAQVVQPEYRRAKVLMLLVEKLSPELLSEALEIAQSIQDENHRASALMALADRFPEVLPNALEAAQLIQDENRRIDALTALAAKLPKALPRALEAVLAIESEYHRADALTALAVKVPEVLPKVLEAVLLLDEYYCIKSLTTLVHEFPEVLPNALKVAQSIQDEYRRADALTALADKSPDILPEALETAQFIQDEYRRAKILAVLAGKVPKALPKALEATQSIQDEHRRVEVFIALADKLSLELLPNALEVTQSIQNKYCCTEALTALVDRFPEVLPRALEVAQSIQNEERRAVALTALGGRLSYDLLTKTIERTQLFHDQYLRVFVLKGLADKFPEVLPEAMEVARATQLDGAFILILPDLMRKVTPELLPKALEVAQAIQEDSLRTQVLVILAEKVTPELLPKALEVAQAIQDASLRTQALVSLAGKLPEAIPKALEAAQAIQDTFPRTQFLTVLAGELPEILPGVLEATQSIQNEYLYAQALAALTNKFPEVFPKALKATLAIQDPNQRVQILTELADKLTPELISQEEAVQLFLNDFRYADAFTALVDKLTLEMLPMALQAAQSIQDVKLRIEALAAVANKLPEALPKVLEAVYAAQDEHACFLALTEVAEKLTPDLLPKALELVQLIQDSFKRAFALTALVSNFPEVLPIALEALAKPMDRAKPLWAWMALVGKLSPELLPSTLQSVQTIEFDFHRARVLAEIAGRLPEFLPNALEAIQVVQYVPQRADALTALADKLTPKLLPKALEILQTIQDDYSRAKILVTLADKFPEILPKALKAVQAIQDNSSRKELLMELSGKLTLDLLPETLEVIQTLHNASDCVWVLTALADKFPDVLPQALEASLSLDLIAPSRNQLLATLLDKLTPDLLPRAIEAVGTMEPTSSRTQALTVLVPSLVRSSNCCELWKDLLHVLSSRTRADLLSDLTALAPIFFNTSKEGVAEIAELSQDMSRWWP